MTVFHYYCQRSLTIFMLFNCLTVWCAFQVFILTEEIDANAAKPLSLTSSLNLRRRLAV